MCLCQDTELLARPVEEESLPARRQERVRDLRLRLVGRGDETYLYPEEGERACGEDT